MPNFCHRNAENRNPHPTHDQLFGTPYSGLATYRILWIPPYNTTYRISDLDVPVNPSRSPLAQAGAFNWTNITTHTYRHSQSMTTNFLDAT